MRTDALSLVLARCFLAALFLPAGIEKAVGFSGFAAAMAGKGVPFPEFTTVCAIAAEIGGAVALVLGLWPRATGWLLVVFTLVATWVSHRYWIFDEPARSANQTQFYKNLAIVGGLMLYAVAGAGPIGLQSRISGKSS